MTEETRTGVWYAAGAASLAVLVTAGLLFAAVAYAFQERQSDFRTEIAGIQRGMELRLVRMMDALGEAITFHQSAERMSADDFRLFAERGAKRFPFVSGVIFAPRVDPGERAAFEAARAEEGLVGFAIRDRAGEATLPAPLRAQYLPILFVEPFGPQSSALLGIDLEAAEGFAGNTGLALSTGKPVLARVPGLFSEWHEFWLLQGVYRGRQVPDGREGRLARASAVIGLRIEPEKALREQLMADKNLDIGLFLARDGEPAVLVANQNAMMDRGGGPFALRVHDLLVEEMSEFAGLSFVTRYHRVVRLGDLMGRQVLGALAAGAMLSLFLGLLTLETLRRRRAYAALEAHQAHLEALVAERTAELQRQNSLLESVDRMRALFIHDAEPGVMFNGFLKELLAMTGSEFGFVGEVCKTREGRPCLKTHAITDISWNGETRRLYAEWKDKGFMFDNMNTLFGAVIVGGQPVIANDPATDPRRGGPPPGHPELRAFLGLPIRYGEDLVGEVGIANRPGGYDEDLVEFLEPLLAACGQIIVARRDHEARAEAEAALARTARELQRSNAELQQFAYAVSHDLQEPLRTVTSYMQLLDRRFASEIAPEAREFVTFAVEASRRMQAMIRDLLEYSRIQAKGGELRPTDLELVLADVRRNLASALADVGGSIEADGEMPILLVDEAQMVRLFQNLVGNGLKYRKPDVPPVVRVRSELRDGEWVISVADNGIGIDPKYFDRIFGVFTRLHTREEYEGTGIGLALCRRIAERHGGRIWVESEEGQGSTFFVAFPNTT